MKKTEELKIKNLQDGWSMLYLCLAKAVVGIKGIDGEAALREGIREFGYDPLCLSSRLKFLQEHDLD